MKYNWSIVGHENQLRRIEKDLESGNLAHAYLLVGPGSIGKYEVAKKMAGILQCDLDFCHECPTCLQVQKGSHIDTVEMKDDGESIKIDEVRRINEHLNMTRQSNYKILLIQSLERMPVEAANSFLKILEEPPERTIFIMTSNNVRLLLPTVVSRVRMLKFSSVSHSYLSEKLRELYPKAEKSVLEQVSLFSMGKTGKAVRLMESPEVLADYVKVYRDVQNFLQHRSLVDRFSYVDDITGENKNADLFLDMLRHVLRSKMLELNAKVLDYIKTLSKIDEAGMLLKRNVNPRLVLENLMLSL